MYKYWWVILLLLLCYISYSIFLFETFEQQGSISNQDYYKDKVVLITGSTRGIGLVLAKKFAINNAQVIIHGREKSNVEKVIYVIRKYNTRVTGVVYDISIEKNIEEMFNDINKQYGRIDILINNAIGRFGKKTLTNKSIIDWKKEVDINIHTVFSLSQKVILLMKSKKKACKIINISSHLSKHRDTTSSSGSIILYKALLERMSEILAHENFKYNISITVIRIDNGNFSGTSIESSDNSNSIINRITKNLNRINDILYDNPNKVAPIFLDIIKKPHHHISGKLFTTSAYNGNEKMSNVIPAYQIMMNKKLFKNYKFTPKKGEIFIAKQNPYGTSEKIKEFIKNYNIDSSIFNINNDNDTKLLDELSKKNNIGTDQIVLFKTEYDAIKKIFSLFLSKYSSITTVFPCSEYIELLSNEMKFNIQYTTFVVNEEKIQPKYKHILNNITTKTKLVYLSSPNSITGQPIIEQDFKDFIDKLNDNIIILIDQLFLDFVIKSDTTFDPIKYLNNSNIIILRSFSNFYGFENLEISYIISNKTIISFIKDSNIIQNQTDKFYEEMAIIGMNDTEYYNNITIKIKTERERLYKLLSSNDISYFPSETNYILLNPNKSIIGLNKELEDSKIIIEETDLHYNDFWPLPISTSKNNDKVIDVIISKF